MSTVSLRLQTRADNKPLQANLRVLSGKIRLLGCDDDQIVSDIT